MVRTGPIRTRRSKTRGYIWLLSLLRLRSGSWYGRDREEKKGWHRWLVFKEVEPGHHFQTRYNNHRQRRQHGATSSYGSILNLVGGSALVAAGFALLSTPGPSYIIIVLGM